MVSNLTNKEYNDQIAGIAEDLGRIPTDIIYFLARYPNAQQDLAKAIASVKGPEAVEKYAAVLAA